MKRKVVCLLILMLTGGCSTPQVGAKIDVSGIGNVNDVRLSGTTTLIHPQLTWRF